MEKLKFEAKKNKRPVFIPIHLTVFELTNYST